MQIANLPTTPNPNIRFYRSAEAGLLGKIYTPILQFSLVVFSISLVWFAFVYYPRVVQNYKDVPLPVAKSLKGVSASFSGFPIETEVFRITYEDRSSTYYIFAEGRNLPEFVENRNSAILALKSALSLESVCNLDIFYIASGNLDVPENLKNSPNC